MHTFKELVDSFETFFTRKHFPPAPATLYEPGEYFLSRGGKRIRPVMCLMGNELFDAIQPDSWAVATAIELFHNFTLIHDDIMDAAPLRRGMETVHVKYGESTALLAGDVMMIRAYEQLSSVQTQYLPRILQLFNKTAREVCEGQQLDMDFEKAPSVPLNDYIHMITLKTSVLLATSLQTGAVLGGASEGNCQHMYEFGKNLGIAFQVQDDYLDAFGDPEKFGKEVGGDIRQNKKTFLLLHALETASPEQRKQLQELMQENPPDKVQQVLQLFRASNVDAWATKLKDQYLQTALHHLDAIAVVSARKKPLRDLAEFLIHREY
ncbi:MAG: polyprenyl synthetase family protein [Sediminibacterium magnilacihabitans]|jgi:geranylgeranyl diphosphate synthase type II|nr:polyprenyl synthetase family protein [Sediminibacterium magnilacihabitans]PQV60383.1 geranylgeranyl diphosphate synthase type II [Sediminibacterium magnilacihabitans]